MSATFESSRVGLESPVDNGSLFAWGVDRSPGLVVLGCQLGKTIVNTAGSNNAIGWCLVCRPAFRLS